MKLVFEDKRMTEETKWYEDDHWYYPKKIAKVLNDTILELGIEGTSVLVSDLMNELGLTYSDPSSRDSYRKTVMNNLRVSNPGYTADDID